MPQTLAVLKSAGLRFWMLTGDKPSTAQTIAKTCNLMPRRNLLRKVEGATVQEVGDSIAGHLKQLVLAGRMSNTGLPHDFADVTSLDSKVSCVPPRGTSATKPTGVNADLFGYTWAAAGC